MAEVVGRSTAPPTPTPTFKRSRIKPEIYKTTDGKVIVEDELLHFLSARIKTLSQDEIVLLATNTFDTEGDWGIEESIVWDVPWYFPEKYSPQRPAQGRKQHQTMPQGVNPSESISVWERNLTVFT